ncbi:hypothetical protein BJX70DRAFT_102398 [Aspergillus crustosus]
MLVRHSRCYAAVLASFLKQMEASIFIILSHIEIHSITRLKNKHESPHYRVLWKQPIAQLHHLVQYHSLTIPREYRIRKLNRHIQH